MWHFKNEPVTRKTTAWLRPVAVILSCLGLAGSLGAQLTFVDVAAGVNISAVAPIPGDHHGPGAVFADLNRDGFPEIYITRGDPLGGPAPIRNELYLNVVNPAGGRTFQLLTNTGAEDGGDSTGAIAADYDNDGDVDLYVLNFDSPNVLLQSQLAQAGTLTFLDVTLATDPTPGVPDNQFGVGFAIDAVSGILLDNSLTAAWADVDRDNDLDLYVGNHNGYNAFFGGVWIPVTIEGPDPRPGRRDVFYLNNGNGTFQEVTTTIPGTPLTGFETPPPGSVGITATQRYSSTNAVIFADFNNDRWPDLLVTNKIDGPTDADMLYLNRGSAGGVWQGFTNVSYTMGAAFAVSSPAAMGVDVGDADNDGDLDIFIADLGPNEYFVNQLNPTGVLGFRLSASPPSGGVFSWGTQWLDADNDGWQDLHVATNAGLAEDLYWNRGAGGGFVQVPGPMDGAGMPLTLDSRGAMTADYDKDGWIDIFVVPMLFGSPALCQNRTLSPDAPNTFLHLKLVGNPAGPGPFQSSLDAIGARATVTADLNGNSLDDVGEVQIREVVSGSSNATSTSSLKLEFGTGLATTAGVLISWPSGAVSFLNLPTQRCHTIDEALGLVGPC